MGRPWRSKRSKDWQLVHLARSHHGKGMILMDIYSTLPSRTRRPYHRTGQSTIYFGIIDDIWEVHYGSNMQILVFRCRWVKHPKGVEVDGYGLTIVDLSNVGYRDDPWVLGSQVAQVLYVADPAKKTKHVVVPGKQDIIGVDGIDDVEEYNQYNEMNLFTNVPQKMSIIQASIRKDDKP
jgi:hypothetical protein